MGNRLMNVVVEKSCRGYVMDTPVCHGYKTELDQLLVFHVTFMVMTEQAFRTGPFVA